MNISRILIVDDNIQYASKLNDVLVGLFKVEVCHSEKDFYDYFAVGRYDLLIIDMRLDKDREGLKLLRNVMKKDPLQAAIVMTAYADMETYTDALESGAITYLDKNEFSPALIARTVEAIVGQAKLNRRVHSLQQQIETVEPLEIIGAVPAIRQIRETLRKTATSEAKALLIGESGSGKCLAARNLHHLSQRYSKGPFVKVNCNRVSQNILISNLFGLPDEKQEIKSKSANSCWLTEAKDGVLMIEGVEELNDIIWSGLVSLVTNGFCNHPESSRRIETTSLIILSTSPSDNRAIKCPDLSKYVVQIRFPNLYERIEDIALLAQYFLQQLYRDGKTLVRAIRGTTIRTLEELSWPGNVKELQGAIAYAAIRADAVGDLEIGPEHLPRIKIFASDIISSRTGPFDYQEHLARAEVSLVDSCMDNLGTVTKKKLSVHLGYNDRYTFHRRIKKIFEKYPKLRNEFPRVAKIA